jgi:type IV pilus assembly protein PilM
VGTEDEVGVNSTTDTTGHGAVKVLLVAAPKDDVRRYEEVLTSVGLEMSALEIETFSLVRSLVGQQQGTHLIVDVGARATNIILVENGIIFANRNVDFGGIEITQSLSDSLNISAERAEQIKKEQIVIGNESMRVMLPTVELLKGEIERIIASYKKKSPSNVVNSIILSGGTGKLYGLDKLLAEHFGIQTVTGNPWSGVAFDQSLAPAVAQIGPTFSVVLGLALRGIEDLQEDQ